MESFFIFKDKNSLDYNIVIQDEDMPIIQAPERDIEVRDDIPGRDGFLTFYKNRMKPVDKSITGILIDESRKEQVYEWLQGAGELILSNDNDVFYKTSIINQPEFNHHWTHGWEFEVAFKCQPYRYLHAGKNTINIINNNTTLYNEYEETKPYLKIFGNGQVDLFINNDKIILNLDGYVEIDSELMESWKEHQAKPFKGKFPTFKHGESIITWDGNISKVEVIPRWRK